ncbi:putative Extracellular solute-binding protein family 1 [Vibrio nigripulchritudo SO65]|nr:putative Extracellular solute-binding protein family 1 [Vibrio nigripulchritudo AM115]CCN44925.1 putative Extracellular solute-binding protein family 1 [Vibrio nigripulchritudo FTn2]CCN79680.1 putative Extracellular solute-binding protein family 1 [Vibrio nigripulchritudo SO65]
MVLNKLSYIKIGFYIKIYFEGGMSDTSIELKGLAWDHERCWAPLELGAKEFNGMHPEVTIQWDRRSLFSFGEGNLDAVVEHYDLIMIDHPFAGESVDNRYFHDLTTLLPPAFIENQRKHSVGPSFESYRFGQNLTALPVDAACQVAAYRPDLFEHYGWTLPRTYEDLITLGNLAKVQGLFLGYPAVQVDIICSFLTISANLGYPLSDKSEFWTLAQFQSVCHILKTMLSFAHPDSFRWNPVRCYEHMTHHDDVLYCPLGFGYLNYSAEGAGKPLAFSDIISFGQPISCAGALLGGAGLAITTSCQHPEVAASFAAYIASEDFQTNGYVKAGGQAGHSTAWDSEANNAQFGHFFINTRKTIDSAYLRPRFPGFMDFFRDAAIQLTTIFTSNAPIEMVWRHLRREYEASLRKTRLVDTNV